MQLTTIIHLVESKAQVFHFDSNESFDVQCKLTHNFDAGEISSVSSA